MARMKIIVMESILVERKHVEKDSVLTVEEDVGRLLMGCGRAVVATDENLADLKKRQAAAAEAEKAAKAAEPKK